MQKSSYLESRLCFLNEMSICMSDSSFNSASKITRSFPRSNLERKKVGDEDEGTDPCGKQGELFNRARAI